MLFQGQLKPDPLPWLLEAETPGVRYLAMRDLLGLPQEDPELSAAREEAHLHGPISTILKNMHDEGYWVEPGPGYSPKYHATIWSLIALAQLGARTECDERIHQACEYMLDHACTVDGRFTASGSPSGTADCLQGNLCWALVELGYEGPRLEHAFEWMARSVTGEGVSASDDRQESLRYYASGNCGPCFACGANNKLPCAWGAVKVMHAFSALPASERTPLIERAIERGVDFLLSTDPARAEYPSGYSAKPSGNWWKFGFPVFYITDLLQLVEVLANLGMGNDLRLANALAIIRAKQDEDRKLMLEYSYEGKSWADFGKKGEPNKWVTLRALRVLEKVGGA